MATITARKQPVQARSRATVEAILEATARVLLQRGGRELTTTRVAETAGVGVGTLYQYFPSKEALLAALLDRQMLAMESAIAEGAARAGGDTLDARLEALIDGLLAHKKKAPELSVALRAELVRIDGQRRVAATLRRIEHGVRALLERHADELPGVDLAFAASVLTSSIEGTLTAFIDRAPSSLRKPALREALLRLARGYLREAGWRPRRSRRASRRAQRAVSS